MTIFVSILSLDCFIVQTEKLNENLERCSGTNRISLDSNDANFNTYLFIIIYSFVYFL